MVTAASPRRNVFRRLLGAMIAFGLVVGMCFPFVARVLLDSQLALTWDFFLLCMAAGCAVGLVNYLLFHLVISRELSHMIEGMQCINARVTQALHCGDASPFHCLIEVSTNDQLGEAARAFNTMGEAIGDLFLEEQRLRQIMALLARETEPGTVADHITRHLPHVRHEEQVMLLLRKQERFVLTAASGDRNLAPEFLAPPPELLQQMLDTGRPVPYVVEERNAGLLLIPIRSDKELIALLGVSSPSLPALDERLRCWNTYSELVAPYLHNAQLYQQLQQQASIDPLTRIFNRRFGMRRLHEEFRKAQRHQSPLSLIMLDLDFFKNINDTHGHQAGDMVLGVLTMAIGDNLRQEDVFCRYGGEEFLIVLPNTPLDAALRSAERLRYLVSRLELPLAGSTRQLTVSLGVATWPLFVTDDVQALLRVGDQALYLAKHQGRNRVAYHDGVQVTGDRKS